MHRMLALVSVAAALLVACGGSTGSSSSSGSSSSALATPTSTPVVKTATATVTGTSETILTNAAGMTLYYYTPDQGGQVTCTAACAAAWPPLKLAAGVTAPTGDKGVTGKLATVANPEGGTQVTYNGWPLYLWVKDKAPGDTTGEGVGGKWHVVTPNVASAT